MNGLGVVFLISGKRRCSDWRFTCKSTLGHTAMQSKDSLIRVVVITQWN